MRRIVVLLTLAISFLAPLAISVTEAAEAGTVQAPAHGTDCKRRRAKKQGQGQGQGDDSKPKKKDKEGKKPYGFEL
jgi:Ni/Co efflux regulator RcnB